MGKIIKDNVPSLVREIKKAIQNAQNHLDNYHLMISNLELEIKTKINMASGGELKLGIVPVELSANLSKTDIHTITISLTPVESSVELLGNVEDELTNAIKLVGMTIQEAATSTPAFELENSTINLNFGVSTEGKISIIAEAGGARESTHTIKLTLKKK